MLNIAEKTNKIGASVLTGAHLPISSNADTNAIVDMQKLDFGDLLKLSEPHAVSLVDDVQDYRREQLISQKAVSPTTLDAFAVNYIKDRWLLRYSSKRWHIFHTIERFMALCLLIALSPTLLILGLLIKLSSKGPAIFKQRRLGYLCTPFTIYKFRTMVEDAEASGPQWASENDSRYTRIGNFLRSTRLDELPQLWNIVKGDMGLIGFRPIRLHFADMLNDEIPHYELRFFVKPGLTGWPQIWHDYAGTVEGQKRKFEYELYYLLHANVKMDIKIVTLTMGTMINRLGQ